MKNRKRRLKVDITLTRDEVSTLEGIIKHGNHNARVITRARILLLSHEKKTNTQIVESLECALRMICNVRRRYAESTSIPEAITDAPRPGQPKRITPRHEAFVIATACTDAPLGHDHWTLPELRKALLKRYKKLRSVSDERVRHILLASELKPWREKNVVRAESHAALSGAHG